MLVAVSFIGFLTAVTYSHFCFTLTIVLIFKLVRGTVLIYSAICSRTMVLYAVEQFCYML